MKSLRELQAIRDKMKANVNTRDGVEGKMRILVGMATCGIAAGARPVLNAFSEEIAKRNITHAVVSQTGCIGICQYEPVVEIVEGDTKTTYVKVDAEKVQRIVSEHVIGKKPVTEFTIGAIKAAE
ncbi:MAG: (2Fe-2S) ferredoxin domain-containing protein [Oscillospiraceae bacterium]|nr:(2Fe-2S) ferredoxin domain-containing protein [Oscillospiraceae bacterium]MBQ5326348.1 (2Fe-2S) ferredoxin domain-containing protein [Oscillospiraceae bacterium]MBQ7103307.1 (2Fe-2S) ferredoxin domain-containing protein [Anaerotignum sp.]